MGKKILYIVLAVIVLAALYYFVGPNKKSSDGPTPGNGLPTESEFDLKLVYTTDTSLDPGPYEADCEAREGYFDACGTTCEPEAEFCADLCAYTCDLKEPEDLE